MQVMHQSISWRLKWASFKSDRHDRWPGNQSEISDPVLITQCAPVFARFTSPLKAIILGQTHGLRVTEVEL